MKPIPAEDRGISHVKAEACDVDFSKLPSTMPECASASVHEHGNKLRLVVPHSGLSLTYSQLNKTSSDLAAGLITKLGLGVSDVVATLLGNSAESVIAGFACSVSGLVWCFGVFGCVSS